MNIAQESPRFVDNTLYWYQGNTWSIQITFTIYNEAGQQVNIEPTDIITVNFKYNKFDTAEPIKTYTFTNISDNTISIEMDEITTQLFPRGEYVFGITYTSDNVNTIIAYNDVIVEAVV